MVPPKDKAFLDIKLVQECMDAHAKRIGIAYSMWLQENQHYRYQDGTWINWKTSGPRTFTDEELYNKFIESITK